MENYSDRIEGYQGFPWLIFKLGNTKYAINSKIITYISSLPSNITLVPNSSNYIEGIMKQRGEVIPLLTMRVLFCISSLENEYKEFESFILRAEKEHLDWVNEFKKSIENGTEFTLNRNPGNCEFGKWCKSYNTDNDIISYHIKKIEKLYEELYLLSNQLENCAKMEEKEKSRFLKEEVFPALERCSSKILKYLNKILSVMKDDCKRMVITIKKEDLHIGIIVDNVCSVEKLECITDFEAHGNSYNSKFILGVGKSQKSPDELILMLNEDALIQAVNEENINLEQLS